VERLKDLTFLNAAKPGSKQQFFCTPGIIYFRIKQLETFFENHEDVWFLAELDGIVGRDNIKVLLAELGVEDKPRRILVQTDNDWTKKCQIRKGVGHTRDIYFHEYDMHGLADFIEGLKNLDFPRAVHHARLLWDFLVSHLETYWSGKHFF
jgi:hypothetical protein